jgi:hypothetical protein
VSFRLDIYLWQLYPDPYFLLTFNFLVASDSDRLKDFLHAKIAKRKKQIHRDVFGLNLLSSISRMLKLYYIVDFNYISIVHVRVCLRATEIKVCCI